jgi:hypothetical protein
MVDILSPAPECPDELKGTTQTITAAATAAPVAASFLTPRPDALETTIDFFVLGPRRRNTDLALWAVRVRLLAWMTNSNVNEVASRGIRDIYTDIAGAPGFPNGTLLPGTCYCRQKTRIGLLRGKPDWETPSAWAVRFRSIDLYDTFWFLKVRQNGNLDCRSCTGLKTRFLTPAESRWTRRRCFPGAQTLLLPRYLTCWRLLSLAMQPMKHPHSLHCPISSDSTIFGIDRGFLRFATDSRLWGMPSSLRYQATPHCGGVCVGAAWN